jgi:undecaprenyl-diphosphatase
VSALLAADERLFHLVNGVWTSRFLDAVLPALSDADKSASFWAAIALGAGFWVCRERRSVLKTLAALVLTVGACDLLAYRVLKQAVRRPRPEYSGISVVLRAGAHGRYGFPSNHAANCFAVVAFLGTLYPAVRIPLFLLASVVAYSRVYVGAHFPLDVAGGAAFGSLVGWTAAAVFRRRRRA